MKAIPVFAGFLLLTVGAAQQPGQSAKGVIYGTVIGEDGNPAKGIRLVASPLGVPLSTILPKTRTDENGKYRFESMPWWGRYTVYAEDPDAGYSIFATGTGHPAEVMLSQEHPEAEFDFRLPPRAGFLQIHLTNRRTGAVLPGMQVTVLSADVPGRLIFGGSCASSRSILISPDKNLLLHVTSRGFREWEESAGRGKPIRLTSGSHLKLDVQLEPSD